MTTAIAEGRDLHLGLQGIERPFVVRPLPARRGKLLTDRFVNIALNGIASNANANALGEEIFIEALGPENYARACGGVVELTLDGEIIARWVPDAESDDPVTNPDPSIIYRRGGVLSMREPHDDENVWGEAIRHEEIEAITLAAFYWQTVVGMEAVQAFLDAGEGQAGSLKALGLLLSRRGLSVELSSSVSASGSSPLTADSTETTPTEKRSAVERLPAAKRQPHGKKKRGK